MRAPRNSCRTATARSGTKQFGCGSDALWGRQFCLQPPFRRLPCLPNRDCNGRHVLLRPGFFAGYAESIPSRDWKERSSTVRLRLSRHGGQAILSPVRIGVPPAKRHEKQTAPNPRSDPGRYFDLPSARPTAPVKSRSRLKGGRRQNCLPDIAPHY